MIDPRLRQLLQSSPHLANSTPLQYQEQLQSEQDYLDFLRQQASNNSNSSYGSNDSSSSYDNLLYDGDYFDGGMDSGCEAEDLEAIDYYLRFHTMVDVYANTAVGLLGIAANMIVIPILCR